MAQGPGPGTRDGQPATVLRSAGNSNTLGHLATWEKTFLEYVHDECVLNLLSFSGLHGSMVGSKALYNFHNALGVIQEKHVIC